MGADSNAGRPDSRVLEEITFLVRPPGRPSYRLAVTLSSPDMARFRWWSATTGVTRC